MRRIFALIVAAAALMAAEAAYGPNSAPNPYRTIDPFFHFPAGRPLGSVTAVDIDPDGRTIWIAERCGGNTCAGSMTPPIMKFDRTGILLRSFGEGLLIFPHGICVDRDGNVWVTDGQAKDGRGMQVWKFSPEGRILMTLGKPGGGSGSEGFHEPNDVLVAPNGDIFVAEGHTPDAASQRIVKFDRVGKYLKEWGSPGAGPGQFEVPHALAMDSAGRLFVGDRGNDRIQIFDQDGNFLAEWKQFGRPGGLFIDSHDTIYAADSESTDRPGYGHNPGFHRGIRIGNAKDGNVTAFIPDPSPGEGATSGAEGVATDVDGSVFGAEVEGRTVKKYVKD